MKFLKLACSMLLCVMICLNCVSCAIYSYLLLGDAISNPAQKDYYSDRNNFVIVTAVCFNNGYFNDDKSAEYFINVTDMMYEHDSEDGNTLFSDNSFYLNKSNTEIVVKAGIEEKLSFGKTVTFISAPAYFGDGYTYPIVAIEIEGEVLLDFDTGYKNLMATYGVEIS